MKVPDGSSEGASITSPFSEKRASPRVQKDAGKHYVWIIGSVCAIALLAVTTGVALHYLNDPYRKLEQFPVNKYFTDFKSLAGLKFRAVLRVEADLGWKDGIGRLMAFTPSEESQQIVVFIPPNLSNVFFNKGQDYTVELEVKEGGLIYADSCRKN